MLETAIISGVIGYIYTVLMDEPNILFNWWKLLNRKLNGWKLYLLTCSKCISGQIALWTCVINLTPIYESVFIISLAILTAKILERWS
jgi:hypothetical protein